MGRMPKAPDELALVRRYVVWSERSGGQRSMDLVGTNPLRKDEPEHDAFTAALAEDAPPTLNGSSSPKGSGTDPRSPNETHSPVSSQPSGSACSPNG